MTWLLLAALALGGAVVVGVLMAGCGGGGDVGPARGDASAGAADATMHEEPPRSQLVPGLGIGPVALGARFADVRAALGEPAGTPAVLNWLGLARYPGLALELLLSSSLEDAVSADALVIGVSTTGTRYGGALRPGRTRAELEALLGRPPDEVAGVAYYPAGLVIEYVNDASTRVAVVAPWTDAPTPPAMRGSMRAGQP